MTGPRLLATFSNDQRRRSSGTATIVVWWASEMRCSLSCCKDLCAAAAPIAVCMVTIGPLPKSETYGWG
jgi:hypothetical protein